MRLAYMTGEYPRISDTFIQREVTALRAMGASVVTLSIRRPGRDRATQPIDAAPVRYILPANPARLLRAHLSAWFRTPRRCLSMAALAWRTAPPGLKGALRQTLYFLVAPLVANALRENRIEHLHNHFSDSSCTIAMLASELSGIPFSFTIHGPAIFFHPEYWRLDEKLRRAAFVNCISHFCRSQAKIFADPSIPDDRFQIIHCGVEASAEIREHAGVANRLMFVGRLARVKGVHVLIAALSAARKTLPDLTLMIAGDGPEKQALQAEVERLGLTAAVEFAGALPPGEIARRLKSADIFVMSSYAEGVPVVLMEAMSSGAPVIAPLIAGIPELVQDGITGALVRPDDAAALANAIVELALNPERRNDYCRAARAIVQSEFNIHTEMAKMFERLRKGLPERGPEQA